MPMKKRHTLAAQAAACGPLPVLPDALTDELVKGAMTPSKAKGLTCVEISKAALLRPIYSFSRGCSLKHQRMHEVSPH
jgi:hypothetical protein